ncbi:hypothetical protein ACJ41O_008998 [Fusarium nematophilum]
MWKPYFNDIDPVVGSAGAAVLSTTVAQRLSSRRPELFSEILCWILLPILFGISRTSRDRSVLKVTSPTDSGAQPPSSRSQWVVAVGVAAACLYRAESSMIGFLPMLTPLLLAAQRHLRHESSPARLSDSWLFSPLIDTIGGASLVACVGILALSNGDLLGSCLSLILVAAMLAVYVSLLPKASTGLLSVPQVDVEAIIVPLSIRVLACLMIALAMQHSVLGFLEAQVAHVVWLGLAKASSWYFTIRTARQTSWFIATTIGTFSIAASNDPFMQSSEFRALASVLASSLTLGQTIHILPKQAQGRSTIWVLLLLSLLPYISNIWAINKAHSLAPETFPGSQAHPVQALVSNARINFDHLLRNQSQSYTVACDEYRRRYSMEPPPGFEAWYNYAVSHHSPIIDEYDTIYDSVSPFWKLTGQEVSEMMTKVQRLPDSELWMCDFSGKTGETKCNHPHRTFDRHFSLLFDTLLKNSNGALPDIKFAVNHFDEPRVLIPPRALQNNSADHQRFHLTNMSKRSSWDIITRFCTEIKESETHARPKHDVDTFGLSFVQDHFSATDLCQHPEYSNMHGFLMCPKSFRLIEGVVPVLSTGAPSTMGDILFPSPAYIEPEFQYDAANDVDWDRKWNNLYWAGSTTGGYAQDDQWRHHHRQRFVSLAQNLERKAHSYIRKRRGGSVEKVASRFFNSRLFDVAFTRIFQCDKQYCRDETTYFRPKSWAGKDKALGSRLVFDMDGNGISGRFYKLLASNSVPLKQTIFREWHDERLVPWVHYVPVSQSLEELPELVFYLTSTEDGKRIAREIAEAGSEWFGKAFREVDMGVYMYRLVLELARLQDPGREAS